MKTWHIYGLHAVGETRIRYVGYTTDPHVRLLHHISNARTRRRNYPLYDWIRSILATGSTIEMQILESGSGDAWGESERRWIAELRASGLFNICDGGYSAAIPDESRKRAGEKLKNRVFTDEHRARISKAKRGQKRPDAVETARAMGIRNVGKKMTFSDEGLRGRSENGKRQGSITARKMWDTMTPEELQKRRDAASEQMKRVWAERRAKKND